MNDTPYFGMFTDAGNRAVYGIALMAKTIGEKTGEISWSKVQKALELLAEKEGFEEATDTEVREAVYMYVGFAN